MFEHRFAKAKVTSSLILMSKRNGTRFLATSEYYRVQLNDKNEASGWTTSLRLLLNHGFGPLLIWSFSIRLFPVYDFLLQGQGCGEL